MCSTGQGSEQVNDGVSQHTNVAFEVSTYEASASVDLGYPASPPAYDANDPNAACGKLPFP